jgi:predicted Zn-dependent protease
MAIVSEAWDQFRPNYPPVAMASVQAPRRRSIERLYQDDVQWLRTRGLSGEREGLRDLLNRNPNDQEALKKMARLYVLENKTEQARELYQRLARLQPNEPSYRFETGLLHLTDNQLVCRRARSQARCNSNSRTNLRGMFLKR